MGTHADLLARHRRVLPSWMALYYDEPISIVDGDGRHVTDAEGNRYLDFFGGILTTMSGYNVPEIVEAIKAQADRMLHTSTLYLIESQIALAEKVAELSGIPDAKVFFTNSGTEANDAALMLATQRRKSNQILAIRGSYHGKSHSAVAVTGIRSWSATTLSPFNVHYVHGGYTYRSPFGHLPEDEFIAACVDDLRNILEVATAGDVAAMIAEPIQGVGGFVTPPDGFFGAMKEVLDEHGILFITDEVQTGWGRTGEHFWGYQAHGITPDILTFAKGLGNGLAMAGVVASAELMDSLPANSISTFGGNPLSTAGALANLEYVLEHDLQTNASKVGRHLKNRIDGLAERSELVGEVRGKGLMLGVELVQPGGKNPNAAAAAAVMEQAKKEGLLIGKGGVYGNVLRIAPALTLTEGEADEGYTMLERAIARAQEET
jgi:4-aminobutyrate aminotransferase